MNIVLHCQFDYIKLLISCQATVPPFSLFFRVLFTKNPASSLSLLGIQNRITPPSSSLASGTGFRGLDFYNFFVNNLFNFSPVRFSFPLFYRYLRWKSELFLQPVCHFYQRCFSNFFPLFLRECPGISRWKERSEKIFSFARHFYKKRLAAHSSALPISMIFYFTWGIRPFLSASRVLDPSHHSAAMAAFT